MCGETASHLALFDTGHAHCFGETPKAKCSDLTPFRLRSAPAVDQIAIGGCRTGGCDRLAKPIGPIRGRSDAEAGGMSRSPYPASAERLQHIDRAHSVFCVP